MMTLTLSKKKEIVVVFSYDITVIMYWILCRSSKN